MNPDNPFSKMQRDFYAREVAKWSPADKNPVVGAWDAHEAHADYDLLFDGIDTSEMTALDFGCGPGRMMKRYMGRFYRIDGADIDLNNIEKAYDFVPYDKRSCDKSDFWHVNTDEAVLIEYEGEEIWIPRSQIEDDQFDDPGTEGAILNITRWIADQKGIEAD